MNLLDPILPHFEFRERHTRVIPLPAAAARDAVRRVDLSKSPFIAPLFALRALPAKFSRSERTNVLQADSLGDFFDRAFVTLHDAGARGFVVGAVGAFWRMSGGATRIEPREFATYAEPGCARLAWSFEFDPRGPSACEAITETRIHCNDAAALSRMRPYWLAIRPASGLIRREILRLIEREAR